jgi:hypothetical protein
MNQSQFDKVLTAILKTKENPKLLPKMTLEELKKAYQNNKQIGVK